MEYPQNQPETEEQTVNYEHLKSQVSQDNLLALISQTFPEDPKEAGSVTKNFGDLAVFPYKSDVHPDDPDKSNAIMIGYWDYLPQIGDGEKKLGVTMLPETPEADEVRELIKQELAGTGIRYMV